MKKLIALILSAILTLSSSPAFAEMLQNPYSVEFNGEILGNDIYNHSGHTYINIQDAAAFYNLFAEFDGETVTISENPPYISPLTVYNAGGILCVSREDAQNMVNTTCDEYEFKYIYSNIGGSTAGVSSYGIFAKTDGRLVSPIPFFKFGYDALGVVKEGEPIIDVASEVPYNEKPDTFIPLDVYENAMAARLLAPQYNFSRETADIYYKNSVFSLPVKNINGSAYFKVRDLAEAFGFEVDFADGRVKITDENAAKVAAPNEIEVHRIDGIRYISQPDADKVLEPLGYRISAGMYEVRSGQKYGGIITAMEKIDGSSTIEEIFEGSGVPYMVYGGARMYYYDFFVSKGIL